MKDNLIVLVIFAGLFGCSKDGCVSVPPPIKMHQRLDIATGVYLVMDSVLNDSRCPAGAMCIAQGNAAVRFMFSVSDNPVPAVLNTSMSPRDTVLRGYQIKLIELMPVPAIGKTINQLDYSAQVEVTKK